MLAACAAARSRGVVFATARRQRCASSAAASPPPDAALSSPPPQLPPAEAEAALAAARAAPTRPGRLFACTAVQPGSLLSLHLPATRAQVAVLPGPPGELSVEVEWQESGDGASLSASPSPIGAVGATSGLVLRDSGASPPPRAAVLRAWVPERFASVRVASGGGGVSVCALTEADCDVDTRGGGAALGAIRGAARATVRTHGGDCVARSLGGARVAVDTGGGSLRVGRVVGRAVALLTHGGEAHLGVIFADRLRARTGGGDAAIEALRVGRTAALDTGGGAVALRALDGAAGAAVALHTRGGAADVALEGPAASMARTTLRTAGGDADVALPPGWPAPLTVNGDDVAPPAAAADAPPSMRSGDEDGDAIGEGMRIDSGAGAVRLRARTWLEGALAASARKKSEAAEQAASAAAASASATASAFVAALPPASERAAPDAAPQPLRVLYDGECPLCVAEIKALRRRAERLAAEAHASSSVRFVDIAHPSYRAQDHGGVEYAEAMASIHALTPDGRVLRGVAVFHEMYAAVGLGWLMAPTRWPRLAGLAERTYDFWAERRLWLTGRPGLEAVLAARRAREAAGGDTCGAACERPASAGK